MRPIAFYYRHFGKTAGNLARTHGRWAIECEAMQQLCRPYLDLAKLPWGQIDKRKDPPGRPYWFQRIVWDCEAAARRHAHVAGWLHCDDDDEYDGPVYTAAYLESYAEWFPKLLAEALAARESQPWD